MCLPLFILRGMSRVPSSGVGDGTINFESANPLQTLMPHRRPVRTRFKPAAAIGRVFKILRIPSGVGPTERLPSPGRCDS